jgi:hypothetical protein
MDLERVACVLEQRMSVLMRVIRQGAGYAVVHDPDLELAGCGYLRHGGTSLRPSPRLVLFALTNIT